MEIRVLGSLEVVDDDGRSVAVPGSRLTTLLIALVVRCGQVVSDDRLFEIVWKDDLPARAANALQRQVSTLRRVLGRAGAVERKRGGYALNVRRDAIDIFGFESLAARGREALRAGEAGRASALLEEALGLWRGDALVDVAYETFAQAERLRLAELRIATVEARIDADLALGRHSSLVGELKQLVLEYPMREHLRAQSMLALSRSGRQAEALQSYRDARTVLGEELGLEPSPELRSLEIAILKQDDATIGRDIECASPRRRTNLRTPLTSLVGRRGALDELRPLIRTQRLVTLVGPGGVGKTRLAIEAAREALDAHTEVWFVDLSDVAGSDDVVSAIVAALDLPLGTNAKTDFARLVDFLCGRGALVILDNCEHIVASTARIANDLLELCATLKILATSREALGVPSEVVWPVPPLTLEDAISLFVERGTAAASVSDLTADVPARRELLQTICAGLDGLPLAIELAASRLRAMPLGDLASGLNDRYRLLNRGARTARPRQQTLRAVVDWSYDLLFEDERRVFDRLSIFTGGCAIAAARIVCTDDELSADDVAELLTRLADKSLITIEEGDGGGDARCRMLQTLVEYGRERLAESGDAARVRAAHARYYSDLALRSIAALRGERQREWLDITAANMGNLRAVLEGSVGLGDAEMAHRIAGSLGWYWWFTGRALEGSRWLELAHTCTAATQTTTRARLLAWTAFTGAPGFVSWSETDEYFSTATARSHRDLDELCDEAVSSYRDADAVEELAGVEIALAVTQSARGNHAQAHKLLLDAEQILAGLEPTPWATAMRAFASARRAFGEDRYAEADDGFRVAIPLLRAIGAEVHCAFAYRYVGRLSALHGDHDASTGAINSALQLARGLGLSGFANVLLTDLGASLAAQGAFERARRVLEEPLAVARDHRSQTGISESLTALAWVEWRAGNVEEAARLAAEALDPALSGGSEEAAAHCLAILGLAAERRGDVAEAGTRHRHALEIASRADEPRRIALALEALAAVAMHEGDALDACRLLGAAASLRRSPGQATGWAFALASPVERDQIVQRATAVIGAEAAARALASGAADSAAVITSLAAAPFV